MFHNFSCLLNKYLHILFLTHPSGRVKLSLHNCKEEQFYNLHTKKYTSGSWVLVAPTCNPNYSGGRDQEDHGLKPALANSLRDPR
jgi:hypothetical protein